MQNDYWHYEIHGDEQLPVILFLHGFLGSGADWQQVIERISLHFRCLVIDLPGHGRTRISSGNEMFSMPATANAIIGLMDRIKIKKCSMVGYSMGGRLALYLALHYPERFTRIVLESASPGLLSASERAERREHDRALAEKLAGTDLAEFLAEWYANPLFESMKKDERFHAMLERRLRNDAAGLAKSLLNMGTGAQPSLWDRLESNKIPLLLLAGEFDVKFKRIAERMKESCPHSEVKIAPGCGHNIHFENPELFAAILEEFL